MKDRGFAFATLAHTASAEFGDPGLSPINGRAAKFLSQKMARDIDLLDQAKRDAKESPEPDVAKDAKPAHVDNLVD